MTFLSVIIAAYNAEATVARAVASGLAIGAEVIVVDDGSVDSTGVVAGNAGASVISQANTGAAKARMKGLDAATGELLLFLDADDWLVPDGVRALCACLEERPESVGAIGLVSYEARGESSVVPHWREGVDVASLLARAQPPAPPAAILWRRAAFEASRSMEPARLDLRHAEDYESVLRMADRGPLLQVEALVCRYSALGGKSSQKPLASLTDAEQIRRYYARYHGVGIRVRGPRLLKARVHARRAFEYRVSSESWKARREMFLWLWMDPRAFLVAGFSRLARAAGRGTN